MSMVRSARPSIKPTRHTHRISAPFGAGLEDTCPLPSIDGSGLSKAEFFRINGAMNRARVEFAYDFPEASSTELAMAAWVEARCELRQLLKDRPPAPCCDDSDLEPCQTCAEVTEDSTLTSDEGGPAMWSAWTDEAPFEHFPETDRLDFRELVEREANRYRSWGNSAGQCMAESLDRLSESIRLTGARTPEELEARLAILDDDLSSLSYAWEMPEREPELLPSGRWA